MRRRISVQRAPMAILSWRTNCWPVGRGYYRRPRTLAVARDFETAEVGRRVCGSFAPYRTGTRREKFASADLCLRGNPPCRHEDLSNELRGLPRRFRSAEHVGCEWILPARPAVRRRPTRSAQRRNVFGREKRDSLFRDGCVEGSDVGGRYVESSAVSEQHEVVTADGQVGVERGREELKRRDRRTTDYGPRTRQLRYLLSGSHEALSFNRRRFRGSGFRVQEYPGSRNPGSSIDGSRARGQGLKPIRGLSGGAGRAGGSMMSMTLGARSLAAPTAS
jgi:hypothetical protein